MYDAANLTWKAFEFAKKAHEGQFRKYNVGVPYLVHPARVASRTWLLKGYSKRYLAELVSVAWLHDVIEDCGVTKGDLILEGFTQTIVDGVEALTNPSKAFPELNRSKRKEMDRNHCAGLPEPLKAIKLIDRIDNLRDMHGSPHGFITKYLNESNLLVAALKVQDTSLQNEYMYASNFLMGILMQQKKINDMEQFREVEY